MRTVRWMLCVLMCQLVSINAVVAHNYERFWENAEEPPGITNVTVGRVSYPMSKSTVDIGHAYNASQLNAIDAVFNDPQAIIDSVHIEAVASPDGNITTNNQLAQRRVELFKAYLTDRYPGMGPISTSFKTAAWSNLIVLVDHDFGVPSRGDVLAILNADLSEKKKGDMLKKLADGKAYQYIAENILEELRYTHFSIMWREEPVVEVVEEFIVVQEPIEETITVVAPEPIEEPMTIVVPVETVRRQHALLVKTNAALLAATVFNAGVEYSPGQNWSIDFPIIYTPYMVSRKYRIEALAFQPEFRYWLREPFKGHFFGAHAHWGWFTVSMNGENRYQDKDGDTPLWGFGASYGYAMQLNRHWGLEFTLGAGYARIEYDVFHNYHNGAKHDSGTKNYWGITRLGINLSYKINISK